MNEVNYKVTITKTADGNQEYMQIISEDQFSMNIVLIGKFEVLDTRQAGHNVERSTVKHRKGKL